MNVLFNHTLDKTVRKLAGTLAPIKPMNSGDRVSAKKLDKVLAKRGKQ